MQSWEWGEFKKKMGWQVRRIGLVRVDQLIAGAQVLFRPIPILPLTIGYIPKGPIIDLADRQAVQSLFEALHTISHHHRSVFVKIEPNILDDDDQTHTCLKENGWRPSAQTNHPRCTIILDLTQGEKALFSGLRKKTRRLIRCAQREGVQIVQGDEVDLDEFYHVVSATAEIKEIKIHDRSFYRQGWQAFQDTSAVNLFLAKYQDETVAAKMVFIFRDTSLHFWGGTSKLGREVYASYLIQWEAIRWAVACGLKRSDLWGIPDEIAALLRAGETIPQDRCDGLWGVYIFKRGFGGHIESYVGAYDYVYHPALYWMLMKILGRSRSLDAASSWLERFSGD